MRRVVLIALLAVLATAASGRAARAEDAFTDSVDLQLAGNASVRGTLRSAAERERFLLRLLRGSVVSGVAKRKGKGRLVPKVDFVDGLGDPLVTGAVKGKGSSLRSAALDAAGDYRVRVFGDGATDGDYQLKLTIKPQVRWKGSDAGAPGGGPLTFTFDAPAGAAALVTVAAGKGSSFDPVIDGLDGPDGPVPIASVNTATKAATKVRDLGGAGTYTVRFHDEGGAGGTWAADVKLRVPRPRKSTIDISASALTGSFSANVPVFGREIGPEGGLVDPPDDGGALDGASVSVPEGSLGFPVIITMHEADPFELLDGNHEAGTAIDFGPTGTEFDPALAATVTIPYDASQFTDPETELHVYVLHDGVVTEVSPLSFPGPGLVSFPTTSFSTFVAARSGPRPLAGDWTFASARLAPLDDFSGRSDLALGFLRIDPGETFTIFSGENPLAWLRNYDDGVNPPRPAVIALPESKSIGGLYGFLDDDLVQMSPDADTSFTFFRGSGGDVLIGGSSGQDGDARFRLALRVTDGVATPVNLAGKWHAMTFSVGAQETNSQVQLYQARTTGIVTITADGRYSVAIEKRVATADYPAGLWSRATLKDSGSGPLLTQGPYAFLADSDDPESDGLFLTSCVDGDVLVGATSPFGGDMAELVFLVRAASGLTPKALAGTTSAFGLESRTVDPAEGSGDPPGFAFTTSLVQATHEGKNGSAHTFRGATTYAHDSEGLATISTNPDASDETFTFTLSGDGVYRNSAGHFGLVSRRRDLFLFGSAGSDTISLFAGIPGDTLGIFELRPEAKR